MTDDGPEDELDPAEVVPTDNSTGVAVDLDRVAEVEDDREPGSGSAPADRSERSG